MPTPSLLLPSTLEVWGTLFLPGLPLSGIVRMRRLDKVLDTRK